MTKLSLIKPLDQPPGTRRLLDELKRALGDPRFTDFRFIVAYAKSGPIHRIRSHLETWKAAGKRVEAIVGIDQRGTSRDAIELSLALLSKVYVTQEMGITFHPKIYLFKGPGHAEAFVGSNNLTVGGTEKNFESAVHIEFDLPVNAGDLEPFEDAWRELLPDSCPATKVLNAAELARLVAEGLVIDEKSMKAGANGDSASVAGRRRGARSGLYVKPESPLPKTSLAVAASPALAPAGGAAGPAPKAAPTATARGFAIQISPHDNGEIHLSVTAALQNPLFFGWPFTGVTTPKKASNPSYPQRNPDPVVNLVVYGAGAAPLLVQPNYALNTVYYEKKSEIRVTASPLVGVVPDYSVMIMERSTTPGCDYDLTIHRPDSPDYGAWVAACNQTMPGGGKPPRKFGWF